MAVDLDTLERHGCSAKSYKPTFCQEPAKYPDAVKRLVDLISSDIKDGRTMNLTEWRAYHAIDLAFDVSFQQTTPTFIQHILGQHLDEKATKAALAAYGLSEETLFMDVLNSRGERVSVLNPPVFSQILIPLVKSYLSVREGTLFNERNRKPLLDYKPLKMTDEDQVLSEIVTDIGYTISRWYGYPAVLRQAIHQMLKYGTMLTFTREEWHCEEQMVGEKNELGVYQEKLQTVKEGLRYHVPHPTRMFYDLNFPLTSLNTDTGCEFMGHWWVETYGQVLDNPLYWNRKKIFCGTNWFGFPGAENFWKEVMPCASRFPVSGYNSNVSREDRAAWYSSSSGGRNQSIFLTNYFRKLRPRTFGLGRYKDGRLVDTYNYPVWHRFVVAGDDTIIYAAPCAYCPSWTMNYDYDENAGRNPSLALELIPFQDHLGNILTQMIHTAKQNLDKVVFYDTNIVNADDINNLKNLGDRRYRTVNYVGFDSLARRMAQTAQQNAFFPVNLGQGTSIVELLQLIPSLLNILERVMQIAASEAGAQGTHQQSKYELQEINAGSGNRVKFTGSAVDEGMDAWKRQVLDAAKAYFGPDFEAQISSDIDNLDELLVKLGFEEAGRSTDKVLVRGSIKKVRLEEFADTSGEDVQADKEQAAAVFQVLGTIAGQEDLRAKIGADNILTMLEFAARLSGAPRSFELKRLPKDEQDKAAQPPENVLNAIKMAQQATMEHIQKEVVAPVAKEMATDKQRLDQLQAVVQQLQKIYDVAAAQQEKAQKEVQQVKQTMALDTAKVQHAEELKNAQVQAEQRRKEELHQQELRQREEKAALDAEIARKKAAEKPVPSAAK